MTLLTIQDLVAEALIADTYFTDIPVITERKGQIQYGIDSALGTIQGPTGAPGEKAGVCAAVITPGATVSNRNVPGPYWDPITILIHCEENVTLNEDPTAGLNKPALDVAEAAALVLHRLIDPAAERPFLVTGIRAAEPISEGNIAYQVTATTSAGGALIVPTCATPVILAGAITCATPGAAIFWTLSGPNPTPRNATLYSAPITDPGTLRARAWLAGYRPSAIATAVIPAP